MAKAAPKKNEKAEKYLYPSRCGSHKSMIDAVATKQLQELSCSSVSAAVVTAAMKTNGIDLVVCKDESGHYITSTKHLDDGCADPYRFSGDEWRRKFLIQNRLGHLAKEPQVVTAEAS